MIEVVLAERIPIGSPSRAAVATASIPDSTVPTGPSTIEGRFADTARLGAAGPRQEYELVVGRPGSGGFGVGYRQRAGCSGLLLSSGSPSGPFAAFAGGTADLTYELRGTDADPPRTRIVKGPPKRTTKRRAKLRWRASEEAAGFECRVDSRRIKPCAPPKRIRVGRGRHRFRVRATDVAGNVEPRPAKLTWKVRRR